VTGRFGTGESVVLREIWQGRIWFARPAILVDDNPDTIVLHVPSGVRYRKPVGPNGEYLKVYTDDWSLAEDVWHAPSYTLSFAFADTPYGVILSYGPEGDLELYYVNLQAPMSRTSIGFDTVEYLLDVVVASDRSTWTWKDEDELAEAVRRGSFTAECATWIHHWGERAVEHVLLGEPPFDRDWSRWRPDPDWGVPELPEGWDTAPIGAALRDVLGCGSTRA
jgi:predicted RNA-binding protein associated with RNAse of E/G family